MELLKREIKQWEKQFKAVEGRDPTREDIKRDLAIAAKYKLYRNHKKPQDPIRTPQKKRNSQLNTPQKTSPAVPSPKVNQLGPTPQLEGRVLGIFDVITSPQETPVKSKEQPAVVECEYVTPQKVVRTLNFDTPVYLRNNTVFHALSCSPSPLASQRMKKGLSTIISELHDIQEDLKYGDYDSDELVPLAEEGEAVEELPVADIQWKKKGAKRQVRLVKKRARPTTEQEDQMEGKNLKEELTKIITRPEVVDSDASEEWESEKEYTRQELEADDGNKKKPLNGYYKKFKLRNTKKKQFFGKRGRGW